MTTPRGEDRQRPLTSSIRAWLAMVRLPNLPTVPGDPVAGLVLSSAIAGQPVEGRTAVAVALASLCLYVSGLLLNDLHDLPRDQVLRPERPLPTGRITPAAALRALIVFTVLGLLAAAVAGPAVFLAALVLAALIAAYNLLLKASTMEACICMGLCRGASMMLGASAGGAPLAALLPAAFLATAVAAITGIARGEDRAQMVGVSALAPAGALALGWLGTWLMRLLRASLAASLVSLLLAATACGLALWFGLRLFGRETPPRTTQSMIGRLIVVLMPWQAALIVTGSTPGAWAAACILLLAWPFSCLLSRVVNAS